MTAAHLPRTEDRVTDALSRLHADASRYALDRALRDLDRAQAVEQALERATCVDPRWSNDIAQLREQIEADSTARAQRRQAELELAEYIGDVAEANPGAAFTYGLDRLVARMYACRQSGTVGLTGEGGYMVNWDSKCDQVRLCPDEAREETQRVAERYVPPMLEWKRQSSTCRIFWVVLTDHNARPGQLGANKRWLFERFKSYIWHAKYDACPLERSGRGYLRTRKRTMHKFPGLAGALVTQEDPLSADDEWNTHLNCLLLVDGPFDWKELRQEWGRNLEIRELKGDEDALRSAVVECVKYAAQAVPSKSAEKTAEGTTPAPAMVQWPHERWLEWWGAQQGFRRTRSYGVLHGVPAPPTMPLEDVQWVGTVEYAGTHYTATIGATPAGMSVDLIPGNNSGSSGPPWGPDPPPGDRYRPPGYH